MPGAGGLGVYCLLHLTKQIHVRVTSHEYIVQCIDVAGSSRFVCPTELERKYRGAIDRHYCTLRHETFTLCM